LDRSVLMVTNAEKLIMNGSASCFCAVVMHGEARMVQPAQGTHSE
jgi:hypothetical protein